MFSAKIDKFATLKLNSLVAKNNKNNNLVDPNDLKTIARIILNNWYIPFIFAVIAYFIGYFYTYRLTNVFEVSTEILLKSNDQIYQNNVISDQDFYAGNNSYVDNSNEIRVLQSYNLIESAVKKLKDTLQVSYFYKGRLRTTEQFGNTPFNVKILNLGTNLVEVPIDLDIKDENSFVLTYVDKSNSDSKITLNGKFGKPLISFGSYSFNVLISKTLHLSKQNLSKFNQSQYQIVLHDLDNIVGNIRGSLSVTNPDYTNILRVSCKDVLPERAKMFLDTLCSLYIDNTLISRYEINKRTLDYIDIQLAEVSSSLKYIEDTMKNYKTVNNILNLTWEEEDNFGKLSGFDKDKSNLNLQIASLNDLEAYINEDKDPAFLPPSIFVTSNDGFLTKTVTELYQIQIKLNEELRHATEENSNIKTMRENINKIKQDLLVYINNSRSALHKIQTNYDSEIKEYISKIKTIPTKQRDLLNIQRKVQVNEDLYNFLLQKRANTYISKATIIPQTKIIDSPRQNGFITPDKNKIKMQFLFVGLIIGIGLALVKIIFFTTIRTIDELRDITSFPVLGELVHVKNMAATGFVVDTEPKSFIAECFRTLRTNMQYVNLNKGSKIILITSHNPGEGKTFTSINMAAILAKGGRKTIILELDLHKPRVQKALEMNPDVGISTVVIGQTTFDEAVKKTHIENLDVMLSGPMPPNPSEMVTSDELKQIFELAKQKYDYVIIDTPPAGLITDSLYMMQFADMVFFVLNTKFATRRIVKEVNQIIENNGITHFTYILNGTKRKRAKYYYNGYGYGYGYGYGGYGYGAGYSGYTGYKRK